MYLTFGLFLLFVAVYFFSKYGVSFSVSIYFIFIVIFLLVFGSIFVELSRKLFMAFCYPFRLTIQIVPKMLRQTLGVKSPQQKRRLMFISAYFREYLIFKLQPPRSPDLNHFEFCRALKNPSVFKSDF